MQSNQYKRQGDLLFIKIDKIPPEIIRRAHRKPKSHRRGFIIAEGEATGHHHTVDSLVEVNGRPQYFDYQWDGNRISFFEIDKPTKVEHEEHGTITLEPGTYEVHFQREVQLGKKADSSDVRSEAIMRVRD